MVDNPEETVTYLDAVERAGRTGHVFVDLRDVHEVTPDALLALMTLGPQRPLRGNLPASPKARKIIERSGMHEIVRGLPTPDPESLAGKAFARGKGTAFDGEAARDMVQRASELLGIEYHRQSYSNLNECATNTHDHAGPERGQATWHFMLAHDRGRGVARFIFLDHGEGICRTVARLDRDIRSSLQDADIVWSLLTVGKDGLLEAVERLVLGRTQEQVRRRQLRRQGLRSRSGTGEAHRGRGLKNIRLSIERGNLSRLVILANRAYIDVTANTRRNLSRGFGGTLIYWEVSSVPHGTGGNGED